jgi:hypothetical protein
MSSQLHHVVMCSHSADDFVTFLTGVVGMTVQQQFHVPGELLESTLGWPPSSGTEVTMVGSGDCGLIEVLDVPAPLREAVPEGLAALSFLSNDGGRARERADASAHDTRSIDIECPATSCSSALWAVCRSSSWAVIRTRSTSGRATRRTPESCFAESFARVTPVRPMPLLDKRRSRAPRATLDLLCGRSRQLPGAADGRPSDF